MAEGGFSPDLLLTVGADLTALRQQLATIQREIGATPISVGLQPQQAQQTTNSINELSSSVRRATESVRTLRAEQEATARAIVYETQKITLAQVQGAQQYEQLLRRLGVQQGQAVQEDEARTRRTALQRIAAEREYQNVVQQSGRIQSTATAENEARIRQRGLQQIRAEREYQAEIQRTALLLERQTGQVQAAQARLSLLQQAPAVAQNAQLRQSIQQVQGQVSGAQASIAGGVPLTQIESQALRNSLAGLNQEVRSLGVSTAGADGVLSSFFGKLGRYTQIAIGLTVVYGAMRAAFAATQEFVEVDHALARIAATMERGADRTSVLRGAYDLMVEANQKLGTSFSESGKLILELEKSLGNNVQMIKAAFLPALTLTSIGEGNQTEILRTLIGLYKVFGDVLGDTTPQQKYLRISDALIASSAASIQDIDGFRTALQSVAPVARQSNVSLEETLALLVQLTNGMQSASRAGTGLRHLFDDLQSRPQEISRAFGLPFDPDAPLNAATLLDQVIRKIRELGTDSLKARAQLQAAFPDERGRLAISTLVALYPQYSRVLNEVANASGRTAEAQRELSNTVSAALGRLSGTAFAALTQTVSALFGFKPGDASGLVGAIDSVSSAADRAGTALQNAIVRLRQLFALTGIPQSIEAELARRQELENLPAPAETRGGRQIREAQQAIGSAAYNLLPRSLQTRLTELQQQLPENQRAAAANALTRLNELERQNAANLELSPDDTSAVKLRASLTRELEEQRAKLIRQVNLEYAVHSKDVDIKERIAAADALLVERTREREAAETAFTRALSLNNKEIADPTQAKGTLKSALEAERRARQQAAELRREDNLNHFKAINDEMDRIRELGHLYVSTQEEITARRKTALGDEVEAFRDAQNKELKAATDKYKTLYEEQQDQLGQEQYRTQILEALRKVQVASFTDAEALTNALSGQVAVLREIFRQAEAIGVVKIAPEGFQTLDAGIQAIIDKTLGIDKVVDATREMAATMGLVGAEAARAAVAARFGFESFEAMLELANQVRQRQRQGVAGPPTPRENAAVLGVPGAQRTFEVTQTNLIKQAEQDATRLDRAQRILQVTFGQTTEETIRQSIAIGKTGKSFEELAASTDESERKYAGWIAKVAAATAEGKIQAEVLSLMAAGFDELTAKMIATQNEADRIEFEKLRQAGESLEEFNTRAERMRDAISKIAQENARLNQDPFSFLAISLKRASDQANEFWASLKTLAEDTTRAMGQSWSDFFFDSFQEKLTAGKDAWKSFLGSMERALADFMSKQLVRSFLNLLLGSGGEAGQGQGGALNLLSGGGAGAALGGIAGGLANVVSNAQAGGISGALFGLPATPNTVQVGLPPSSSDLEFAGLSPTTLQTMRQATSGLIGTGGTASKELAAAGAVAAAYTASQSVLKLTNELSTQQDRNAGTGGLVGAGVGGAIGAFFGQTAIGAGAGGLLGNFLGGLFGSNAPPAGRFDEINRTISTVQTSLEAMIAGASTFTALFSTLLGFQGGGALAAATQQPVSISVNGQPISSFTQSEFLSAVRANPSSLQAGVQAGVNPSLLGPLNQEVVNSILARISALDQIGQQINETIADILAQTVVPVPTGATSLETLKQQAVDFRAVVDTLIATNVAQTEALEAQLAATTDPALVLQYTTTIKGLIEKRYQDETQLVQKFAGQLDSLANSLKNVSASIEKQIFDLQLSNFGPTNPLAGLQLAQGKFDAARSAFFASPTPENAQALQALVDPLLKSASEVFTRPSPEYRAIFDEVVATLEQVKGAVDSQANDISDALAAALGTSNSLQDLTQKNTAAMAADMKALLAIVTASAAAAGINLNAGTGILLPGTFPAQGQPVQPLEDTREAGTGDQTAAGLTAAGVLGILSGGAGLISPALALSEKLGLTEWLKTTVSNLLSGPGVGTSSVMLPSGGSSITNPDILGGYYTAPSFTIPDITIPDITIPNITLNFGDLGSYSFSDLGSYDYGYFQSGGNVPGSGRGDIVPAMLEPGEFVIPRHIAMAMRPFLENLIGGKKSIPIGPQGLQFATGGSVPMTSQDIQALILLQALLGTNNTQTMTQQQIAANTQLTAAILQQLAQRSGISTTGSSPTVSTPTTPSLTLGQTTASPSAGLSLDALKASLRTSLAASSPSTLLQIAQQLGVPRPTTAGGSLGTVTGSPSGPTSLGGSTGISGTVGGGSSLDSGGGLVAALSAFSPILSLLSTASTIQGAASGVVPGDPGTLGSILGIFGGGLGLLQGIENEDIFSSVAGGIQTIANLYNLAASLSGGALPGLSEVIGGVVTELAGTLGFDAAFGSIPAAGVIQAIIAAIKIAQIASSNQSDEEKAIQAAETAVLAAGAIAAPFTFGASLAVVQIIDFIERIRAGQDWDQALIQANDPTGILNGFFGEDVSLSGQIFNPSSDWQNFGTELAQDFSQGAIGLNTLQAALPYVQSKGELGRLIETYKNYVATTNDWTPGVQFGSTELYKLGFFPEAGGSEHEGGLTASFGSGIAALQSIIDQLYNVLPGDPITAGYGANFPNGGISGSAEALRLWDRFVPGGGSIQAQFYVPETDLNALFMPYYQNFGQQAIPQSTLDAVLAVIAEAQRRRAVEQAQIAAEAQAWYEYMASQSPGGLAAGGWVTGGTAGQDSVLKRLMPDEFVVPAAVARANAGLLTSLVSDGTVRSDYASTISTAARSGDYRSASGVSQVALNIHPGAIQIDGAKDPKAVSREVLDAIEQNIRTGRLGQVIVTRVRQQRS